MNTEQLREQVQELLPSLEPVDQQIMTMRFGLGSYAGQPCNLAVVADALHLDRLTIRDREARIVRAIKRGKCGMSKSTWLEDGRAKVDYFRDGELIDSVTYPDKRTACIESWIVMFPGTNRAWLERTIR